MLEQVGISLEQVSISLEQVSISLEQVSISLEQVSISLEQVGISLEQVSISLEQVSISLEQVGISLEQVSILVHCTSGLLYGRSYNLFLLRELSHGMPQGPGLEQVFPYWTVENKSKQRRREKEIASSVSWPWKPSSVPSVQFADVPVYYAHICL